MSQDHRVPYIHFEEVWSEGLSGLSVWGIGLRTVFVSFNIASRLDQEENDV